MSGRTPRTPRLTVPVSEADHARGPADAPVTLVEYGDFQCPHCKAAHPVVERLRERFGPRLRVVFRHFPMATMHPSARLWARATEAAARQDERAFWAFHDRFFERRSDPTEADLVRYAGSLGLDVWQFQEDLESDAVADAVQRDFIGGARSGVNGTPSFFLDGERYDGPYTVADLSAAIEERLDAAGR